MHFSSKRKTHTLVSRHKNRTLFDLIASLLTIQIINYISVIKINLRRSKLLSTVIVLLNVSLEFKRGPKKITLLI